MSVFEEGNKSHCHWVQILTSEDITIDNHKHTHYVSGNTNIVDGHYHTFTQIATLGGEIFPEREGAISPAPKTCKYKYNPLADEE